MSDHRYGRDMGLPPFQPSTATDSCPPVPLSALSASDSGRRRGGTSTTSSSELQTVRVPLQMTRGSRDSTVSAALGTVPSGGVPHAQSAGPSVRISRPVHRFYEPAAGSYGACGSFRCPGHAIEGFGRGRNGEAEGAASVTRWFGRS